MKILVADMSLSKELKKNNIFNDYTVLNAKNGIETMMKIKENTDVSLIILDLNMPDIDGFQILEELRSNKRYGIFARL